MLHLLILRYPILISRLLKFKQDMMNITTEIEDGSMTFRIGDVEAVQDAADSRDQDPEMRSFMHSLIYQR